MLMFICMLSIISGKFESRKFLVFQHLSSIVQIFHTQLNLSVLTYSPAHSGFIRVIGNTETRQALFQLEQLALRDFPGPIYLAHP